MAGFLKGNQLNATLEELFEKASKQLILVSPFVKLHSRFVDVLKWKKDNDQLKITVVFGKNEEDITKSLNQAEFDFLKEFPNIEIRYEPKLHAKYYANESMALLSSMNLYDYSQNHNIEFGILTKSTLLGTLTGNIIGDAVDKDAFEYFHHVIDNSTLLFQRVPYYEDRVFGLSKKYTYSVTEKDELTGNYNKPKAPKKIEFKKQGSKPGYCIRTGVKIPFNRKRPFSESAFISWNRHKNEDYPEKYCHYSGEDSNGQTTFSKPVLRKNWKRSLDVISPKNKYVDM